MNVIVRANRESFKEGNDVCEAIIELFQDEYDAGVKAAEEAGIQRGIQQGLQSLIEFAKKMGMQKNITRDEIREKFNLSEEQADTYMEKYWK